MPEQNPNKKIFLFLINDNDPVLVRVLRNKFEKEIGWQSLITTSYNEAVRVLKEESPDAMMTEIIISDDSGKTGFDLIVEAKNSRGKFHMPIIVFSDLGQEEDKKKAMDLGATNYFAKSDISITDLIKKISEIANNNN